jgi:hypothetical protein
MSGKRWLLTLAVAISGANAGCVSCDHSAHRSALAAGPRCDIPTCERQKVCVFMLNGLTPPGLSSLDGLRTRLAEQGYSKIGSGELYHAGWVADEMKQALADNPDARFVLIGYDLGGGEVAKLAARSVKAGMPIDAVVLLDPVGKASKTPTGTRTLLVSSATRAAIGAQTETVLIPDAGHFNLPTHPKTVAVVCNLLNEIAAKHMRPESETHPVWSYEHAPMPRPMPLDLHPAGNILADRPGGSTRPLGTVETAQSAPKTVPVHHNFVGSSKP